MKQPLLDKGLIVMTYDCRKKEKIKVDRGDPSMKNINVKMEIEIYCAKNVTAIPNSRQDFGKTANFLNSVESRQFTMQD